MRNPPQSDAEQIRRAIQQCAAFPFAIDGWEILPVAGGTINLNACLTNGKQRYLIKLLRNNAGLPLERQKLFVMQQQLAKQGLASQPVFLSDDHSLWLEQWQDLVFDDNHDDVYQRLALSLSQIHQCGIKAEVMDLPAHWAMYLSQCAQPQKYQQQIAESTELWNNEPKPCLCHHDLSLNHLPGSPQRLVLDWEYAARSTPFYDLASCIRVNHFNPQQAHQLIQAYARAMDELVEVIEQGVERLMPVVDLTNALWCDANGVSDF